MTRARRILTVLRRVLFGKRRAVGFFSLRRYAALLSKSHLFDTAWYVARNPEAAGGGTAAARHYLKEGAWRGLDPGPRFSTNRYYQANPDVAKDEWPALLHYLLFGQSEGRALSLPSRNAGFHTGVSSAAPGLSEAGPPAGARQDFDAAWYLQTNDDVRAAGIDPWTHYQTHGYAEGRLGAPVKALELETILWCGFETRALRELHDLMANGPVREQAAAGWVLARWFAAGGDWQAALAAIKVFHDLPEGRAVIRHDGPTLLAVRAATACGAIPEATAYADLLREGGTADTDLARIGLDIATGATPETIDARLARIYTPYGLAPLGLRPKPGEALDRLTVGGPGFAVCRPPETQPLVSIIVPVFNVADTVPTALAGLVSQSWDNLEILVVDDASTDDTADIAQGWAARDPRIRIIRQPSNQGAYVARNAGLAAATGAFITVHDGDDWSHPDKIAAQVEVLLADPDLKCSLSHMVRVGPDLEMTRWRIEDGWVYRNISSLMIRAELRDTLGYWDRVRASADTEYYYRILTAYGEGAIAEVFPGIPLSFVRTREESLTAKPATHLRTSFHGARRTYIDAARQWHGQLREISYLHVPQFPGHRPFQAPAALMPADPCGPPTDYELIAYSRHFDVHWYWTTHPDVCAAGIDPVLHYLEHGWRENRDPGPLFSASGYRFAQGLAEEEIPLLHWEREGKARGALACPVFSGEVLAGTREVALVCAHSTGDIMFGAERSLITTLERLLERGISPYVLVPGIGNAAYLKALRARSLAVEVLPQLWRHAHRTPYPETVEALRGILRRTGARSVHVNTLVLDAPLAAARAEGCDSVVHVRELPAEDPALLDILGFDDPEALRKTLLDEADSFIANSSIVADWLNVPQRTKLWPNRVDPDLFDLPFQPGPELRFALISSNIEKKGVADFIGIARQVAAAGAQARFLLIGPDSADIERLRPWPENVHHMGYAETPLEAIAQTDIVMSLSQFTESFGRTVLEAMAAGRPVITYARGTPAVLVEDGLSGFVVPAGDTAAAAQAVLALCRAKDDLHRISEMARERARTLQAAPLD